MSRNLWMMLSIVLSISWHRTWWSHATGTQYILKSVLSGNYVACNQRKWSWEGINFTLPQYLHERVGDWLPSISCNPSPKIHVLSSTSCHPSISSHDPYHAAIYLWMRSIFCHPSPAALPVWPQFISGHDHSPAAIQLFPAICFHYVGNCAPMGTIPWLLLELCMFSKGHCYWPP